MQEGMIRPHLLDGLCRIYNCGIGNLRTPHPFRPVCSLPHLQVLRRFAVAGVVVAGVAVAGVAVAGVAVAGVAVAGVARFVEYNCYCAHCYRVGNTADGFVVGDDSAYVEDVALENAVENDTDETAVHHAYAKVLLAILSVVAFQAQNGEDFAHEEIRAASAVVVDP